MNRKTFLKSIIGVSALPAVALGSALSAEPGRTITIIKDDPGVFSITARCRKTGFECRGFVHATKCHYYSIGLTARKILQMLKFNGESDLTRVDFKVNAVYMEYKDYLLNCYDPMSFPKIVIAVVF